MRKRWMIPACAAAAAALVASSATTTGLGSAWVGTASAAPAGFYTAPMGTRDLRLGDRGRDVKTLHWVLRSQGIPAPGHASFGTDTREAVRIAQDVGRIRRDGVVRRSTRKFLASRMFNQRATWYGPGLYGNSTACGKRLSKATIGVAHRTLPCGTRVALAYRGRWVHAKVIDRGPYTKGYRWDLTSKLAKRLGMLSAGAVKLKVGVSP